MMSNRSGVVSSVPRVAVEKSRRAKRIPTGEIAVPPRPCDSSSVETSLKVARFCPYAT